MKYFLYLLLIIALCGLSAGLAPFVRIYGQVPQLPFLLALVLALEKTNEDFLFVACLAGLFMDVYSGSQFGAFSVPLLLVCLVARLLVQNFLVLELSPKFLFALLLPAQILFYGFYFFSSWLLVNMHLPAVLPDWRILVHGFAAAWLYNLLMLYPIVLLADHVRAFIHRHLEREFKMR